MGRKQQDIAQTVIQELEIHAELKEELIYPAVRKSTKDDKLKYSLVFRHEDEAHMHFVFESRDRTDRQIKAIELHHRHGATAPNETETRPLARFQQNQAEDSGEFFKGAED